MLKYQHIRPKETLVIDEPGPCSWYAGVVDETGEVYGWLGLVFIGDQAGIHTVFRRSIIGIQRQVRKDFERILGSLRSRGIKSLVASNPNTNDHRWPKFIKWLGFPEPELVYISVMEVLDG